MKEDYPCFICQQPLKKFSDGTYSEAATVYYKHFVERGNPDGKPYFMHVDCIERNQKTGFRAMPGDKATAAPNKLLKYVLYLCGPMAGLEGHNWPAFNVAADALRAAGYCVVNPAELHGTLEEARGKGRHDCLRTDIHALTGKCTGVALLPGHEASKGADIEKKVAEALNMPIGTVQQWLDGSL